MWWKDCSSADSYERLQGANMKKYERYIDRFFDEENFENIKLEDNDGKEIEFEFEIYRKNVSGR